MHTLVLNRRTIINAVLITSVALLLLFAWIYGGAVHRALVEMENASPPPESQAAVSAPPTNQTEGGTEKKTASTAPGRTAADSASKTGIPTTAVSSQAKQDSQQFFAQFRLERDRVRSQQIDLLREMVNSPSTSAETRGEAQKRMLELTRQMEQEMELENLMVAKGYPEAAAFIQTESVTVVLFSSPLGTEQKKSVSGLASSLLGFNEEQVSIICRK
ncbi:MAG: SpoIIIAH-like family protein [Firmicutes bacterium]|nr:SpoIIIAH-like family protein [Bacillota bacterium]